MQRRTLKASRKWLAKEGGGGKGPKKHHTEGKKGSHNKFQVLEEPDEITREIQY